MRPRVWLVARSLSQLSSAMKTLAAQKPKPVRMANQAAGATSSDCRSSAAGIELRGHCAGSERVAGDEEAGDEKHEKAEEHEFQPLLDEAAHRLAEGVDQSRFQSEPHAARQDGKDDEQPEIVARKSRRDG